METLSVTSCVLEQYFKKSILHFNFSDDIKIKIYLCIEYSTAKDTFNDFFQETDFEYRGEQPQCCFTFGEKHLPLKGAISVSNNVSSLMCINLGYVRDNLKNSDEQCEGVPLKMALISKYNIKKIAENIVKLLEE